jgi:hypothetical protein
LFPARAEPLLESPLELSNTPLLTELDLLTDPPLDELVLLLEELELPILFGCDEERINFAAALAVASRD